MLLRTGVVCNYGGTLININSADENKLIVEGFQNSLANNSLQPGVWTGGRRSGTILISS